MGLMEDQAKVTRQRGLSVDNAGESSKVLSITAETVQLYYFNSGVATIDAGQAAGTVVYGKLAYNKVLGLGGDVVATFGDKSLTFTSTALTTEVTCDYAILEARETAKDSLYNKAVAVTAGLANGEYVVDYAKGIIYGKKASTQVTLTSTAYSVNTSVASFSGSVTIAAGDIEIGAVELKNATTDTRAIVNTDGSVSVTETATTPVDYNLADTTNVAAAATYYPDSGGIALGGKKNLSITGKLINTNAVTTTLIVQGTNDEDATPANRDWITLYGFRPDTNANVAIISNVGAATTTFAEDFDNINYKYVRVVVTPGDAFNTIIVKGKVS